MRTIPPENFPPIDAIIIEKTERRAVLLHEGCDATLEVVVWLHSPMLGGWYCSPDAGLFLTRESARTLITALVAALRDS